MQSSGMAMNADDIQWIRVYAAKVGGPGATPGIPATCSTKCVEYTWDPVNKRFVYASGVWDSATVNACINDKNRESVGVVLRARHNWMTGLVGGLMGGNKVMTEQTIMQFEPLEQDRCGPLSINPHK